MTIKKILPFAAILPLLLAACASPPGNQSSQTGKPDAKFIQAATTPAAVSTAVTLEAYKRDLAQRIVEINSTKVYVERPQALLRSVIVINYFVDAGGRVTRSDIVRTNHDAAAEATALASLRNAAPFPKPATHLLHQGRVEIAETWLFNDDGRFQLRSVALPQMDQ